MKVKTYTVTDGIQSETAVWGMDDEYLMNSYPTLYSGLASTITIDFVDGSKYVISRV